MKETEKYIEKAIQLDRLNNNYLNELGSQKLSQEKFKEAVKCYNSALKLDESNVVSTLGKIFKKFFLFKFKYFIFVI